MSMITVQPPNLYGGTQGIGVTSQTAVTGDGLRFPAVRQVNLTINTQNDARQRGMEKAWKYYKGQFDRQLPIKYGAVNDNVTLNYCRNIVDKGVAFLFGKEPKFSQDAPDSKDLTDQEKWLDSAWKANAKKTFLSKVAIQGGVTGHVFIKIMPRKPYPRLILLDSQNITVQTDPADVESVLSYTNTYPVTIRGEAGYHQQIVARENSESTDWVIRDYERTATQNTTWTATGPEVPWPYQWCPIVDCQNIPLPNEYYGLPDLPLDILSLNDSINLSASNIARILKHHANPKTWGRGFHASMLESNIDNFLVIPSDTAEVKNLEMHSDLASSLNFLGELETEMHEASRMPEIALGKVERLGAITGVALAVLHSPLLEKTEIKQANYGDMLVELNAHMLEMGGHAGAVPTTIVWPKMLPTDPLADLQAAVLAKNLGVSTETLLQALGYDPAVEMNRANAEAIDAAHRAFTVAQINPPVPKEPPTPGEKPAVPDPKTGSGTKTKPDRTSPVHVAPFEKDAKIAGNGK